MSLDCSLCLKNTFIVIRVYLMSKAYRVCPKRTFYLPRLQFISQVCILSTKPAVCVPKVQSLYQEYILCPMRTVYFPRVQFMSQD